MVLKSVCITRNTEHSVKMSQMNHIRVSGFVCFFHSDEDR